MEDKKLSDIIKTPSDKRVQELLSDAKGLLNPIPGEEALESKGIIPPESPEGFEAIYEALKDAKGMLKPFPGESQSTSTDGIFGKMRYNTSTDTGGIFGKPRYNTKIGIPKEKKNYNEKPDEQGKV